MTGNVRGAAPCIDADVAVLGAGPAAATLALNLAPFCRVVLLDKDQGEGGAAPARIGESLPAAAARLLRDMGLWDAFSAQRHQPCEVHRSAWGAPDVTEQATLRNLDGHGWHLDRAAFDGWLLAEAQRRGAALVGGALLRDVAREGPAGAGHGVLAAGQGGGRNAAGVVMPTAPAPDARPDSRWLLQLARRGRPLHVRAPLLVDASGRGAVLARRLGARRVAQDKLVCGWVFGRDEQPSGHGGSELHAERDGWWYSAPLPGQGRLLAFYTDADLPSARSAHSAAGLLARAAGVPALHAALAAEGFHADGQHGFCAAHGAALDRQAGDGWLAVGDAALAFDPLSAQGVFNALYTGLAGAEAALRWLQGERCERGEQGALAQYQAGLAAIGDAYTQHRSAWYEAERRWPGQTFWRRRHAESASIAG